MVRKEGDERSEKQENSLKGRNGCVCDGYRKSLRHDGKDDDYFVGSHPLPTIAHLHGTNKAHEPADVHHRPAHSSFRAVRGEPERRERVVGDLTQRFDAVQEDGEKHVPVGEKRRVRLLRFFFFWKKSVFAGSFHDPEVDSDETWRIYE